jgi:hypothetical protein
LGKKSKKGKEATTRSGIIRLGKKSKKGKEASVYPKADAEIRFAGFSNRPEADIWFVAPCKKCFDTAY